jgi:Tol biopolymer transport system component
VGETATFGDVDLSPDGKLVAVTQPDATAPGADIYVIDWQRQGVASRLTLDPGDDINPVWARPSGDRIAFTTFRKGNADIYIKNANGLGPETPLLETPENESIEAWSNDGKYIAYKRGPEGSEDIWILPLTGDKKEPSAFIEGPFQKDEPQFSYDGKWLAYTSNESGGIYQVWVVSFPDRAQRLQVSKDGGGQPRWREDGKELFFRSLDGSAMVVDMTLGPKVSASIPKMLFGGGALNTAISSAAARHQWSVIANGSRFLTRVIAAAGGGATRGAVTVRGLAFNAPTSRGGAGGAGGTQGFVSSGLTVIRNWPAAFKKEKP